MLHTAREGCTDGLGRSFGQFDCMLAPPWLPTFETASNPSEAPVVIILWRGSPVCVRGKPGRGLRNAQPAPSPPPQRAASTSNLTEPSLKSKLWRGGACVVAGPSSSMVLPWAMPAMVSNRPRCPGERQACAANTHNLSRCVPGIKWWGHCVLVSAKPRVMATQTSSFHTK